MQYMIFRDNGTYWNDDQNAWGPKQAATVYNDLDSLPDWINDGVEEPLTQYGNSFDPQNFDISYIDEEREPGARAVACVVRAE